jgi:hypothetical protein
MLGKSFPSVARVVLPRTNPRKLALILPLLAVAGCGGGAHGSPTSKVASAPDLRVRFTTLPTWRVQAGARRLTATDGTGLVWVQAFPLAAPYRPALFAEAVPQLDARVQQIAQQEQARVTSSETVTLTGRRGRSYTLERSGHPSERIGFVLIGRREYELYCRLANAGAKQACDELFTSLKVVP